MYGTLAMGERGEVARSATCPRERKIGSRSRRSSARQGDRVGRIAKELTSILTGVDKKSEQRSGFLHEHPRPETTLEQLAS